MEVTTIENVISSWAAKGVTLSNAVITLANM
jgi:hypothetical protein